MAARLNLRALHTELGRQQQEYARRTKMLSDVGTRQISAWKDKLSTLDHIMKTVGYEATLKRGFAVVRDGDKVVSDTAAAAKANIDGDSVCRWPLRRQPGYKSSRKETGETQTGPP